MKSTKKKSTGMIRKVDDLGRIVIPIELRNEFGIAEKDPIEIFVEGNNIILKKNEPNCTFCGTLKNLIKYQEKQICSNCLKELSEIKIEKLKDTVLYKT